MDGASRRGSEFRESRILSALMVLVSLSLVMGFFAAGFVGIREDANSYGLIVRFCGGEWRRAESGGSMSYSFIVVNANDVPVTLDFFTWGWDPPWVSEDFEVVWDYDGAPVPPGFEREVRITVVGPSVVRMQDYSFNVDFVVSMP